MTPAALRQAAEAATDATTAATRAATEAKMGHELSGMLFPWERASFGDRTEGLKWWQKAYWVGFACVHALARAPLRCCHRSAPRAALPLPWLTRATWHRCAMVYLVGEKGYNKATTGKWHGNAPPPKYANKAKPRPTLVKSRVRTRTAARHALQRATRCARCACTRINMRLHLRPGERGAGRCELFDGG
jgi:hypothetical protein